MADAKNSNWKVYRPEWYNDRVLETFISSPIIDKQNDKIDTDTMKESMDFYMKYGVYSYKHEEMPIGLPLAYKIKDGKVKIRVGIHNKLPMHDRVWEEMKIYGDKGGSSIRGEAEKQEKVCEGEVCHNNISELSLWSVSWVGNRPANPEATVTQVAAAKSEEPVKVTKQITLDEIESMVEKIIERKNGEYCLYAKKNRKLLGCHKTRAGAVNQERAIQARRFSKMNEALDDILEKYFKKKEPCEAGYEMIGTKLLRGKKVPNCVPIGKAEYQGRKVNLNKPFRLSGENKKFGVYVQNEKGNTIQLKFGDPKLDIKRDDPERRRNFRARHNCDNPGPKYKARYWSCKMWSTKNVSDILAKSNEHLDDIIETLSKAPRTGRTGRGMRAFMTACVANAKQHLRNYEGLQNVKNPRAFCAELWRDPGTFPGRGPRMTSSRVRDQSGRAFQNAMSRAGWKPKERLRRGRTPSWNKKR